MVLFFCWASPSWCKCNELDCPYCRAIHHGISRFIILKLFHTQNVQKSSNKSYPFLKIAHQTMHKWHLLLPHEEVCRGDDHSAMPTCDRDYEIPELTWLHTEYMREKSCKIGIQMLQLVLNSKMGMWYLRNNNNTLNPFQNICGGRGQTINFEHRVKKACIRQPYQWLTKSVI